MSEFPVPDQTQSLVATMIKQTDLGLLEWERGSSDTEFVFSNEAGSVIISSVDGDGQAPFALRVLDPSGKVVEEYSTGSEGADNLRLLYRVARQASVKASAVVKSLAESLAENEPPF